MKKSQSAFGTDGILGNIPLVDEKVRDQEESAL